MTQQETFDIVTSKLTEQGCKSISDVGDAGEFICAYRGNRGTRCAAGWLIPNDKYTSAMEGQPAQYYIVARVITDEGHNIDLVSELQRVHDICDVEAWPGAFMGVAADFGLKYTPKGE